MIGKCELCGCQTELTVHHLIPKCKAKNKYKDIRNDETNLIMICRQCHDHIHATYDESYLRDFLNALDLLKLDDKIMKFVNWKKKHIGFSGHAKMSNDLKNKNGR